MKLALKILQWFFTIVGVLATALIIYYFPVIDRVVIRPCAYYPNTFADCRGER